MATNEVNNKDKQGTQQLRTENTQETCNKYQALSTGTWVFSKLQLFLCGLAILTHKHSFRSLNTNLFKNLFKDFQKL